MVPPRSATAIELIEMARHTAGREGTSRAHASGRLGTACGGQVQQANRGWVFGGCCSWCCVDVFQAADRSGHAACRASWRDHRAPCLSAVRPERRLPPADGGHGHRLSSPVRTWRDWEITLANAEELANGLASAVQCYAEPYLRSLSSDHDALLEAARNSAGYAQAIGRCGSSSRWPTTKDAIRQRRFCGS